MSSVLRKPGVPARNGSVYIEHTFGQPGKFIGLVTVGGTQEHVARFPLSIGESEMVSHFMHDVMVIVQIVAPFAGGAAIFFFLRDRR